MRAIIFRLMSVCLAIMICANMLTPVSVMAAEAPVYLEPRQASQFWQDRQ